MPGFRFNSLEKRSIDNPTSCPSYRLPVQTDYLGFEHELVLLEYATVERITYMLQSERKLLLP